jgi:autotransporter-associated beta strand protein
VALNGNDLNVGVLSGAGGVIENNGGGVSTLTVSPGLLAGGAYAGVIRDNNTVGTGTVGLVKNGAGSLSLSGANTYSGGTAVNAGQLNINSNGALGSGAVVIGNNVVLDNTSGGAVSLVSNNVQTWNGSFTFVGSNDLNLGTGAVTMTGNRAVTVTGGTLTVGGPIGESVLDRSLTKSGAGTLVLGGNNTYGGTTTITGGTLVLGAGGATGSVLGNIVNNAQLVFNRNNAYASNGIISGLGSVVIAGTGTQVLTLGGANTYTGGTVMEGAGTVVMGSATALGAATGNLTMNAGTLDLNNFNLTVGLLSGTGGTITNGGGASVVVSAKGSGSTTFAGVIQNGNGAVGLAKTGTGTLTLTGTNTYTGNTVIGSGSVLQLGSGGATGSLSATTAIQNGGSLVVNRSNNVAMSNRISGTGSVRQAGTGTLLLSGINTFTGGVVVDSGILQAGSDSALGSGNVVLNGGTLATGGSQNQINVSRDLTWNTNAQIALTLTPDLNSEYVNVNGKLLKIGTGSLNFEFTPSGLPAGHTSFMVMYVAGGFSGLTASSFSFTDPGNTGLDGTFSIQGNYLYFNDAFEPPAEGSGQSLSLNPSVVPEPSTYLMLLLGLAGLAWLRNRKVSRTRAADLPG